MSANPTRKGWYFAKDAQGFVTIVHLLDCMDVLVNGSDHKASIDDYIAWDGPIVLPEL